MVVALLNVIGTSAVNGAQGIIVRVVIGILVVFSAVTLFTADWSLLVPALGLSKDLAAKRQFPPVFGLNWGPVPVGLVVMVIATLALALAFDLSAIASIGSARCAGGGVSTHCDGAPTQRSS